MEKIYFTIAGTKHHYGQEFFEPKQEVITCPDCKNEANVIEAVSSIPCPVCGKMRRGRDVGNWD